MLYINLKTDKKDTIAKQIYKSIKDYILEGTLKENEKLPSTRELCKEINVSRNAVIEAYEQLLAEGYLYTKAGNGTYVNEGVVLKREIREKETNPLKNEEVKFNDNLISFRTGIPDLKLIPIKRWGKIYKETLESISSNYLDYQDSKGVYELRYELTKYLRRVRGVNTTPDNIIITNGAAEAFNMLCKLVESDEYALVENPMSLGVYNTLKFNNVKMKAVTVDEQGIKTLDLPKDAPKLIFTTPSHQFPTGVVLHIKRRIELIEYARLHNSYIVEDDYDSEFRFKGRPIESMQSLDKNHVIYVGTFSKIFIPSLRIGYMVLPDSLCSSLMNIKYIDDIHSSVFKQLSMAKYIKEGLLDLHIKRMKTIYYKKRTKLINALNEVFKDKVEIVKSEEGLHLLAFFKGVTFNDELLNKIHVNNIEITSGKEYIISSYSDKGYGNSLVFGYGNVDINKIESGIKILYRIIND